MPDGTYKVKREETAKLYCNSNFNTKEIKSEDARRICRYRNCTDNKDDFCSMQGFFFQYPNAFDELLTVDALDEKKWNIENHYKDYFIFKAKKRFSLYAIVGENGIVKEFFYRQRYDQQSFVYSKKYNQIFWIRNDSYDRQKPYFIPNTRYNEIKEFIEEIYNYEVTK